jgi:hypothetical protein
MAYLAATEGHADFYVAAATVYAFLFVTLNIQALPFPQRDVQFPTRLLFALVVLTYVFGVALSVLGLGLPLLVLSGFLHDSLVVRVLVLIAVLTEGYTAVTLAALRPMLANRQGGEPTEEEYADALEAANKASGPDRPPS